MPVFNNSVPLFDELPTITIDSPYSIITIGTDGDDSLIGTEETDAIDGRGGNDQISGLSKDDAISGNEGDDTIDGNEGNDILFGHQGDDNISGGIGEDVIIGVDPTSGLGTSEKDSLRGDEGEDTFVLGDKNHVYYVDDDPTSSGEEDYGLIVDFTAGEDTIELNGTPDNYLLDFYTDSDGTVKADIVYDPGIAARGELIGILEDVSADLKLTDSSFVYEENDYAVLYNEIFDPLEPLASGTYGSGGIEVIFTDPGGGFNVVPIIQAPEFTLTPIPGFNNPPGGSFTILPGPGFTLNPIISPNVPNVIEGTSNDDILVGTYNRDIIYGYEGNDNLSGLGNDDTIFGGQGDDTISGGQGNDNIEGEEGDDVITGDSGNDVIAGDSGNDNLSGGLGNDTISGGTGEDTISGGEGSDTLEGGDDDDFITGEIGNDTISGGEGNDNLNGQQGNDQINGGLGNDTIAGGQGDDILNGGEGNDILAGTTSNSEQTDEKDVFTGGLGSDRFILGDEIGVYYDDGDPLSLGESDFALITDFNADQDFIQLHGQKEFYYLDFYTTSFGLINAALMYDPGVTARRELISIIENVAVDLTIEDASFLFVDSQSPLQSTSEEPIPSVMMGTAGKDDLTGTDSDDVITGSGGRDHITTGGGNDQIVYTSIRERGDTITDFELGSDVIVMKVQDLLPMLMLVYEG